MCISIDTIEEFKMHIPLENYMLDRERRSIGAQIQEIVLQKTKESGFSAKTLASRMVSNPQFKATTASTFISRLRNNFSFSYLPDITVPQTYERRLARVSIALYALAVPQDHPVIETLRANYTGFVYPPSSVQAFEPTSSQREGSK